MTDVYLSRDGEDDIRSSLVSFHYCNNAYRFDEYSIGNEWNFRTINVIKEYKMNTTIRLAIASKINDDDYYLIYIPNDDPKDVIIRKLVVEATNTITRVFIIDGPLLIIQRQQGSIEIINLITNTNDNRNIGRITMNEFNLIEVKAYDTIDTCFCMLHFIDFASKIVHKWLCFDINMFLNTINNDNKMLIENGSRDNNGNINNDDNVYIDINGNKLLLLSPPYVNNSITMSTITGIHYHRTKNEAESLPSITTIITTSSGYLYSIIKNGNSYTTAERKLDDNDTNDVLTTTIKTTASAIPNTTSIIIKNNNSDKLIVVSMSTLALLLEVRNVGFFVLGNISSILNTHLLIVRKDGDTYNYPIIILNKNIVNNKSQFILCEVPGLNGSRYMTMLSDGSRSNSNNSSSSWNKRSRLITGDDIMTDKKRKKNSVDKENKKQKTDNAIVITKKQLSDIDSTSQESVIDALNMHLQKIVMTSDVMNNSIDHKKLVLQVLRKNVMEFQCLNNSLKLDFSIVDNNLNYLYHDKNSTNRCIKADTPARYHDKVILMDAAYVKVFNGSSIILFVRIVNKSHMPIFRVKTNVSLISSEQGYMRESKSVLTKSGNVDIVYPNQEAVISSIINLAHTSNDYDNFNNSNLASFNNSNTAMSINLSWTEFKTLRNNPNLNKLSSLFSSDPVRLDIEMSNGWIGEACRNGLGGAMILTSNTDTNTLIMTPFLIAKHCADDKSISKIIKQWHHDATILNNRRLSLVSFMCNLPLILIGRNLNDDFADCNNIAEKIGYFINMHFYNPELISKSNFYLMKPDVSTENELIKTMCLNGFDKKELYNNLISMRKRLPPESSLLLFANNNENIEILRLLSVYLLDEMAILAAAWRMMIMEKTSKKRKSLDDRNKSSFQLRINPRLITPSAVAKVIYSKQKKTDQILSFAFARLNPFL